MKQASKPNTVSHVVLPLRMDPVAGALWGTILLFGGLLIGPGALVLAIIAWMVIGARREPRTARDPKPNPAGDSAAGIDPLFAARFREMENSILGGMGPSDPGNRRAKHT